MCLGFDSRTQRHMWVEFVVGSLLCSERFFSGYSGFPLSSKTHTSKFQFDLETVDEEPPRGNATANPIIIINYYYYYYYYYLLAAKTLIIRALPTKDSDLDFQRFKLFLSLFNLACQLS